MRATEFIVEGLAEGSLNEYRDQLWTWVQSKFPRTQWPEYVQRDFLYAKAKGNKNQKDLEDFLDEIQRDFGRVRWQLEKLPITLDIFTPKTQRMIQSREGGSSNPYQVPKDAERHSLQQKMIQQKGVSEEPIIVAKLSNGYDLIEGWHRTIQHLKEFPQGYTAPAWVGYGATYTSESVEQGVAEGIEDNYNKNDAGIKATLQAGVKLIPIQSNNHATGKPIYIHDYSGRYTVLVDMGGISVPYYVSTGLGGKAGVAVDKWYPFFGIGSDGWINKGSEANINDFYGSNKLKRVAQVLNNTLGLPSRAKNVSGWPGNRGDENYFISAVNRGLDPAPRSDHSTKIRDNMLSVLLRLGEPNKYVEKASPTQATRPKGIVFDKNNPEHVASFNATSQSERELATALAKEPKGVA